MKTLITVALALSLTLVLAACSSKASVAGLADMAVPAGSHAVQCGCALDHVGVCGNYIEIDGQYVEIANSEELGLGAMEWCHKEGVTVTAAGKVEGGAFVGDSLEAN